MLLRSCRSALLSLALVSSSSPAAAESHPLHAPPTLHDSSSCLAAEIRMPEISPQWPYFLKPLRTALVECSGELLYEMVTSLAGEPHGRPEWQVPIEKLWLYSAPNDSARTEHYLVRNELAEMLAFV